MAIEVNISWDGRSAKDYSRVFAVAATIDDFRPAFEEVASEVISPSIQHNFDSGGRPRWEPLSEDTLRRKNMMGYRDPSKILVATGAMEQAATNPTNYIITKDELRAAPFGIEYWGYHQMGTTRMPQRVIMMLQAADRTKITKILADYFRQYLLFTPTATSRFGASAVRRVFGGS
jgi:phage gpG-like protein